MFCGGLREQLGGGRELLYLLLLRGKSSFLFSPPAKGWAEGPCSPSPPSLHTPKPALVLLALQPGLVSAFLPSRVPKVQKRSERVRRAEPPKPEVVDSTESSE